MKYFSILFLFFIPIVSFGAITASDGFESYSTGDLDGGNGGVDWTDAWDAVDVDFDVVSSVSSNGTQAVGDSTGNSGGATRSFTAVSVGTICTDVRVSTDSANGGGITLGGGSRMIVQFRSDATIKAYNSNTSSYETLVSYSPNTWYRICIDFDDGTNNDAYRVAVDGGSYSDWKGTNGTYDTIGTITLGGANATGRTIYYDQINDGEGESEPPPEDPVDLGTGYATSTGSIKDVTFGIGIIVTFLWIVFIGFMYNMIFKPNKLWPLS